MSDKPIDIEATADSVTIVPYREVIMREVIQGGEITISASGKTLVLPKGDDRENARAIINDQFVALGFDSDGEEG